MIRSLTFPSVRTEVSDQVEKNLTRIYVTICGGWETKNIKSSGRTGAALDVSRDGGEQEVRKFKKSEERRGIRQSPPPSSSSSSSLTATANENAWTPPRTFTEE